ncbi:hypothetical protein [Massilia sp. BJB1822]|uniref:hypothetical protein n=1 Tax=Massilia sp. BJB1822 TaxID=2744470 RepID=UPI001592C362|nr:hypothetical protein [Massilia sp. BJB1822]NVE00706.1 hypothetical protein [Massilia sp. BJB1822]
MDKPLRINFELERADNPPLYDELAKFPKGGRRVNRLRTLAHAGLLTQTPPAIVTKPPARIPQETSSLTTASLELFGPPADG